MIKNWTVTAESTKSVSAREVYFNNKEHKNHRHTEAILNVWGSERNALNIIQTTEEYKLKTALKGKGGRPPKEAMELVFTLPKGIRPSHEQWQKMFHHVMKDLAEKLDIPTKELAPIVRAVVHQQNQDESIRGSGDHLHCMIGKFTPRGQYLRDLQKKGVLYLVKQSFNVAVLKYCGIDHRQYEPSARYNAKRRAPQWKVKAARIQEELREKQRELRARDFEMNARDRELTDKELLLDRVSENIFNQVEKWLIAYEQANTRQMKRQANRINKGVEEISGALVAQELSEFEQKMFNSINEVTARVNEKSGGEIIKQIDVDKDLTLEHQKPIFDK